MNTPSANLREGMKNLARVSLILLSSFFILHSTASAQVKWHSIDEAANAKIGTRIYLVDFYTDWCGYCKKMDRETFSDATVAKIINKYFYPVKFNAEGNSTFNWFGQTYTPNSGRRRAHSFARGLQGYPTTVLYLADGKPLQAVPGFYSAQDFVIILWYFASGDYKKYPYGRYQRIFDKEIRPVMEKELKKQ
jgi:thioredoxin-related protein